MAILVDDLSIWDIAFRWASFDPRKVYFRIPLQVENNFRTMLLALLQGNLPSNSISLEKKTYEKDLIKFSVYYWLDDIYSCIHGHKFNRQLLKWATIERWDFKVWCERMNIPLPQFWFPEGWNFEYALPEDDIAPGYYFHRQDWTSEEWDAWYVQQESKGEKSEVTPETHSLSKVRPNQEARIACQQIARAIWRREPTRTIASVVRDDLIQFYGGASPWTAAQVREWIKVVAPTHVREKRGAPKKNKGGEVSD